MKSQKLRQASSRRRIAWAAAFAAVVAIVLAGFVSNERVDAALVRSDPETLVTNGRLAAAAHSEGARIFAAQCAACHGKEGRGDPIRGAPDLTAGSHLYALDSVAAVEGIVRHGIRAGDSRGWNLASMPAFATAHPYKQEALPSLTPNQTEDITQFLLAQSGRGMNANAAARGGTLFGDKAACWDCHGHGAQGDRSIGAPDLTDAVWLYGGDHDSILRSIEAGRAGVCPAFARRLSPAQTRAVAAFAFGLSHGRSKDMHAD